MRLTLVTDDYGNETSWHITDSNAQLVFFGDQYQSNRHYDETLCLAAGSYTFSISDSYGDGICCTYGAGAYSLTLGELSLADGGIFGRSDDTSFTIDARDPGLGTYYRNAEGQSGYELKLHSITLSKSLQTKATRRFGTFTVSTNWTAITKAINRLLTFIQNLQMRSIPMPMSKLATSAAIIKVRETAILAFVSTELVWWNCGANEFRCSPCLP